MQLTHLFTCMLPCLIVDMLQSFDDDACDSPLYDSAHISMMHEYIRYGTFFPDWNAGIGQPPERMARAGFFFQGELHTRTTNVMHALIHQQQSN